jgi:hypothetical protein
MHEALTLSHQSCTIGEVGDYGFEQCTCKQPRPFAYVGSSKQTLLRGCSQALGPESNRDAGRGDQ